MSNHTDYIQHYLNGALGRIERAGQRGQATSTLERMERGIRAAFDSIQAARDAADTLAADPRLSNAARREKMDAVRAQVEKQARDMLADAQRALTNAREHHANRARPKRSTGSDADREARLANARADVDRVISTASTNKTGELADRLRFLVENGSPAVQELLLVERYAERVVFPSTPEAQAEAAMWAEVRPRLIRDRLDEDGRRSLDALAFLEGDPSAAVTIAEHGLAQASKTLQERAEAFGPPPSDAQGVAA